MHDLQIRLPDELLNETLFISPAHVRDALVIRKEVFAKTVPEKQRAGALRYMDGFRTRGHCFVVPTRLKSTQDSAHRWMRRWAQLTEQSS
jgi:hypothetical protein